MTLRLAWKLWGLYDRIKAAWTRAREEQGMDGKALLTSKTFWANVLMALAQFLPGVSAALPPPWGIVLLAVVNVGLRLVTSKPITGIVITE